MLSSDVSSQELTLQVAPPSHWQHLVVLVAEDHSTYRAMMGWFLQKLGLGHQLAEDGRSALAAITKQRFDLVISDCQMPFMDGYSMARAIRLHEQSRGYGRVPIIALTGNLVHDDPQRCRDAGMDAWLLKPLRFEQLREVLVRWLPGPQQDQQSSLPETPSTVWPTRASLIEVFGSAQVVNQMLSSLLVEAGGDSVALAHARMTLNASQTSEHLHRLVGSLAFLGAAGLEARGSLLISEVRIHGVALNQSQLEAFQRDLLAYLAHLSRL